MIYKVCWSCLMWYNLIKMKLKCFFVDPIGFQMINDKHVENNCIILYMVLK